MRLQCWTQISGRWLFSKKQFSEARASFTNIGGACAETVVGVALRVQHWTCMCPQVFTETANTNQFQVNIDRGGSGFGCILLRLDFVTLSWARHQFLFSASLAELHFASPIWKRHRHVIILGPRRHNLQSQSAKFEETLPKKGQAWPWNVKICVWLKRNAYF